MGKRNPMERGQVLEPAPSNRPVIASEDELRAMDPELLRRRWRIVLGRPAPSGLSVALMIRILLWREQIARVGGLDLGIQKRLKACLYAEPSAIDGLGENSFPAQKRSGYGMRLGTVLVREHAGLLHRVMVLANGFAWNGETFSSLSAVAKAITGINWNGRRFFGLDRPSPGQASQRGKAKGSTANSSAPCPFNDGNDADGIGHGHLTPESADAGAFPVSRPVRRSSHRSDVANTADAAKGADADADQDAGDPFPAGDVPCGASFLADGNARGTYDS